MDVDCAKSPPHREQAIRTAWERMLEGLRHRPDGPYEYVHAGRGCEFEGRRLSPPLEHFEFTEDVTPDPGVVHAPNPVDREQYDRWERAEKRRRARGLTHPYLVDFVITAHFRKPVKPGFRVHVPFQHEVQAVLRAQGAVAALAQRMAGGRSGLVTARR
jgi:hypothetical protein